MSTPAVEALRVSFPRLRDRLDALAGIGAIRGPGDERGVSRLALTDADRDGRALVVTWMEELGLGVEVDGIGNTVATWPPGRPDPPVMVGSHIDSVATGGRYDGSYGVLAGLEVLETTIAAGVEPRRPLAVAFFTNEEGARFPPDMMGSLVFVGGLAIERALGTVGVDGAAVGDELARIGAQGRAPCPSLPPYAYVELHVEQGPVLATQGVSIGAVTAVQGISWSELTVTGQANHAGTTPMGMRHDAGYAAAAIAVAVRDLAGRFGAPLVATVGRIVLHPNLVNVVAARATLTVDMRHTDEAVLLAAERELAAAVDAVAAQEGVSISRRSLARFEPVVFAPDVVELVEAVAARLGHSTLRLPSGAGHDAQMLARVCPSGMIFVPSAGGVSHNPAEHTDDADLEAGANVLLQVVLGLCDADGGPGRRVAP
jgi:N-carbamoyl-L-amino-acid hydrolase